MLQWVENRFLAKDLKYWAHCCSRSTNYAEEIPSRKICVTSFLKGQKFVMGKQTQEVFYAEAAVQSRLFKKSVSRNFAEFPPPKKKKKKKKIKENKRKRYGRNLFFERVKL